MFSTMRDFFRHHIEPHVAVPGPAGEQALQLAAAALLFEIVRADGTVKAEERTVMQAAAAAGVEKVVYTSSSGTIAERSMRPVRIQRGVPSSACASTLSPRATDSVRASGAAVSCRVRPCNRR